MEEDSWLNEAAKRADAAVSKTMNKFREGYVLDEDDLTGVLIGNLDAAIQGQIGGLTWTTAILRHRRGIAAEESRIGADLLIHVSLQTDRLRYSKGVLIQAKRFAEGQEMSSASQMCLKEQCEKMLDISASAFVFNYQHGQMRCGPASRIHGSNDRNLSNDCIWTSYRFFLELFRCPVGDPRIKSAAIKDLPVPYVVKMSAVQTESTLVLPFDDRS